MQSPVTFFVCKWFCQPYKFFSSVLWAIWGESWYIVPIKSILVRACNNTKCCVEYLCICTLWILLHIIFIGVTGILFSWNWWPSYLCIVRSVVHNVLCSWSYSSALYFENVSLSKLTNKAFCYTVHLCDYL